MKRIILTIVLIQSVVLFSFSQINIGLSSGINLTKIQTGMNNRDDQVEFNSDSKIGFNISTDLSKEITPIFLIDACVTYSNMNSKARIYSWTLAGNSTKDGDYKINTIDINIRPSFKIIKLDLYFNPGIYMGYIDCNFDGEWESILMGDYNPPSNVKMSVFNGFDLGYSFELKYKKAFLKKYQFFLGLNYKKSLKEHSDYKLSYSSYALRVGVLMTINKD
jgi:hypothetical protein